MPAIGAVQTSEVKAAIGRAAARTGVDFNYLVAQARIESGLDPDAKARTSSAAGLYQFIDSTWLRTLDKHGAKHGMGWAGEAVAGGRISDPAMRAEIMQLRDNPEAAALMAAELAIDNRDGLRASLGREPDGSELYLAHFLGLAGAQSFLGALNSDPAQAASLVNPAAARSNRAIFFDNGRARSVGEVMDVVRGKMAAASEGASGGMPFNPGLSGFAAARAHFPGQSGEADANFSRPSMADTLRSTFGDISRTGDAAGERVARAYGKLRAFSL